MGLRNVSTTSLDMKEGRWGWTDIHIHIHVRIIGIPVHSLRSSKHSPLTPLPKAVPPQRWLLACERTSSQDDVRMAGGRGRVDDEVTISEPVGETSGEVPNEDAELVRDMVLDV
jgi:hypothetical protein